MHFSKEELTNLQANLKVKNYRVALDNVFHAVLIANHKHEIVYTNKSFLERSSYDFSELVSQKPTIFHRNLDNEKIDKFEKAMDTFSEWESDVWFRSKNGKFTLQSLKVMKIMNEDNTYFNYVYLYESIS